MADRTPSSLVIDTDYECSRPRAVTSVINRYYDPKSGEFLSVDPDVATTDQSYLFTNDDPLNSDDPEGLLPGRYSDKYPEGDLQNEITRYLGPNVDVQSGRSADKIIFSDANDPSKQVVTLRNNIGNVNRCVDERRVESIWKTGPLRIVIYV